MFIFTIFPYATGFLRTSETTKIGRFVSDEDILSILERLIQQNREVYNVHFLKWRCFKTLSFNVFRKCFLDSTGHHFAHVEKEMKSLLPLGSVNKFVFLEINGSFLVKIKIWKFLSKRSVFMPVAKEQIRQIISENNLNSVTDVYSLLRDSFKDILDIRRIMYTTNIIEGLNRQYRKVTKTKSVFPSDTSLEKMLYLASQNITKKWTQRYRNWDQVLNQLVVLYGERLTDHL